MQPELLLLGRTIKQIQYRHHRALDARLGELGVSLVQWDALRAMERLPDASAHALAQATFQSDQAFSTLANRLLQGGWIKRQAGAGRAIRHRLTAKGKRVLEQGHPLVLSVLNESFAALGTEERAHLLDLLQRVLETAIDSAA